MPSRASRLRWWLLPPALNSSNARLQGALGPDNLGIKKFIRVSDPDIFSICQIVRAIFDPDILEIFPIDRASPPDILEISPFDRDFSTLISLQLGELSGCSTLTILEFRNLSGFWILFFEIQQISGTDSFAISANAGFQTKMQDFKPRERELCQWTYAGRSPGSH